MHVHKKNRQPTEQFLALCYGIDYDYDSSYISRDYKDLNQFVDMNNSEIRSQIKDYFRDGRLKNFVNELNDELKELDNLQHSDKPLFVTGINFVCELSSQFNIDIDFSDKLSKHQIEQLIDSLSFKDFYFEITYTEDGYYETQYNNINLHYKYSHSRYY